MGDMYERAAELADMHEAGLIKADGSPVEDLGFDTADSFDTIDTSEAPPVKVADPLRPVAKRGRYYPPNPVTGKVKGLQRVTNFVKMTDDTYHLELWKQRNVAKGVAILVNAGAISMRDDLLLRDVKADRDKLNGIVEDALDAAEAHKNADEGTALHKSTELVDHAGGDLNRAPVHHRVKIRMYLDALAAHGLTVAPGMIERFMVSTKYEVGGTFDRIMFEADGTPVMVDLKTGDSVDLAMPSIAAQLECYVDGVNEHGVFEGRRYDTRLKVREDYGIVIHLPSTRDEVHVIKVDLAQGRKINAVNLQVRAARKIKHKHVASTYVSVSPSQDVTDAHWLERLNAAQTRTELIAVANTARCFRQWNERLAGQARLIAAELG